MKAITRNRFGSPDVLHYADIEPPKPPEGSVLVLGWLLGGTVGIGTVAYALAIGPIAHALLPLFTVRSAPRRGDALPGTDIA